MPAPVPVPIRQALWRRHQRGATATELSLAFGIPARTVRGLLKRWRDRGPQALAPDYARRRQPPPTPDHPAFAAAVALRRDHPGWGAGLIRVYLAEAGLRPIPGESTLRRWFRRAGLAPAPPGRRPADRPPRATEPHQTWQVDAAEQIPLGDGTHACWLRVVDEFTGAVLRTAVFPPRALGGGAGGRDPGRAAPGVRPLGAAAGPAGR